jgi:hypothetical protein
MSDERPKVSWEGVGAVEKIISITVGGEVFVRADWDAYDTGYQACKSDALRALEALQQYATEDPLLEPDGDGEYYAQENDLLLLRQGALDAVQALPIQDEPCPGACVLTGQLDADCVHVGGPPGQSLFPEVKWTTDNVKFSLHTGKEPMSPEEQQIMLDEGHTTPCVTYWRDVMTADAIGERWDHWAVPPCPVCAKRRKAKRRKIKK